jgi:hypothetical protein
LWIPTPDGLAETKPPHRLVGAAVLASYNTGTAWLVIHKVGDDRAAFMHAWHLWALRRLKAAHVSAAAAREVEAIKAGAGVSATSRRKNPKTTTRGIKASKRTQRS